MKFQNLRYRVRRLDFEFDIILENKDLTCKTGDLCNKVRKEGANLKGHWKQSMDWKIDPIDLLWRALKNGPQTSV